MHLLFISLAFTVQFIHVRPIYPPDLMVYFGLIMLYQFSFGLLLYRRQQLINFLYLLFLVRRLVLHYTFIRDACVCEHFAVVYDTRKPIDSCVVCELSESHLLLINYYANTKLQVYHVDDGMQLHVQVFTLSKYFDTPNHYVIHINYTFPSLNTANSLGRPIISVSFTILCASNSPLCTINCLRNKPNQ